MNLLSKLLPLSNVELGAPAPDKRAALARAAGLFEHSQGVSATKVLDSLIAREQLGSTGLGKGVAIPHGRLRGLRQAAAAIIRLQQPVAFDSPDGGPVQLMVVLLVPEQATQQHLQILSELAQMLSDTTFRDELMTATQPQALLEKVAAWEPIRPAA
jgi:PTS system nitrogen regulatory IIA component